MYCSRCGKKVLDSMLFCPFCGAQIIIPEQDDADSPAPPAPEPVMPVKGAEPETVEETPMFSFDLPEEVSEPEPQPEPTPTVEDLFPWERPAEAPEEAPAAAMPEPEPEPEPAPAPIPEPIFEPEPIRERRPASAGNIVPGRRSKDTFVPDKPLMTDKSEMFLDDADDFDAQDDDDEDDYDAYMDSIRRMDRGKQRSRRAPRYEEDDEDDEDDEDRSFVMRHIRGIVGILLFLVLLAILGFYALSDSGQRSLARINATLPLKPEIYMRMGYEFYQSGDYAQSGVYYERALARDPDNYDYASSAAMAYLTGGDNDKAAELLRKCIQLKPDAVEPYVYLLNLYPNANSRPWDVAQLLKQGYERTGDARLEAAANG